MNVKKLIISTASAALIIMGGIGIVGAQDAPPAVIEQQRGPRGGQMGDGEFMNLVEQYTGLEGRDIAQAIADGETLAGLIEANGEDVNAFVGEAVTAAEARIDEAVTNNRLTEEQAERAKAGLQEAIEMRVNGEYPLLERGPRGRHGGPGGNLPMLSELEIGVLVMDYTGLEASEVAEALRDGETIASLIEANGGDVEAFIDEATELAQARIDERAQMMSENARETIAAFVNGERPFGGPRR